MSGPGGLLLRQRGHLFPWAPVALACGICLYFSLAVEPAGQAVLGAALLAVLLAALAIRLSPAVSPLVWALALVAAGLVLAAARAQTTAAPVLGWRYYGAVEGRVIGIDRSASDALRLTLDRVRLDDVPPDRTPARVRISLHGQQGFIDPAPGMTVITTAHLSPPGGPVEPGGFDFQRHSWFQRLGGIGYTRTPLLDLLPPRPGATPVFTLRMALSDRIRAVLPGDTGAFATAVMTGDRSALTEEITQALRRTNLAHLLAISGLHMGLVAGFVFAALRLAGAAIPHVALNWPVRSIAALAALTAAAGYLALSGGSIATERAFVMAAVALLALVADRRAISLRALAIAALVVLVLRPEALLSPGFQMSFAATTALVAVFAALRGQGRGWPKPVTGTLTVVLTSTVAGLATAPVGAAHFNMVSHYGLIANLAAVPLMGLFVMPAGVVALLFMPLGLEPLALVVMGWGLDWILLVARTVEAWPGAVGQVPAPGPWVLPLFAGGGLLVALWQGPGRVAGVVPVLAAAWLWTQAERPQVLIEDAGQIVGILGPEGRALSRPRGAGFVAGIWLENDGSGLDQEKAAALWPAARPDGSVAPPDTGAVPVRHLTGKRAAAAAGCAPGEVLVLTHDPPGPLPCEVFAPERLRATGAVALRFGPEGMDMTTARAFAGRRLWNDAGVRTDRLWRAAGR